MRVLKGSLTMLAGEGRITLQVPEFSAGVTTDEFEEIPNDWLHEVRYAGGKLRVCCGKETGFIHFTRKGFEAMRERLRAAFLGSGTAKIRREAWSEFERHAEDEFENIRQTTLKRIKLLRRQADELEAMVS